MKQLPKRDIEAPQINVEPLFIPNHISRIEAQDLQRKAVDELLKDLLGDDIRLEHKSNGSPFLALDDSQEPSLHNPSSLILPQISISHCRDAVAIAMLPTSLSQSRIGVDVESSSLRAERVISRIASKEEFLLAGENALLLWSAKESVYKAFSDQLSDFTQQIVLTSSQLSGSEAELSFSVKNDDGELYDSLGKALFRNGVQLTYAIYPTPHVPVHVAWRDH